MLIIAERINASRKYIAQAISSENTAFIQDEAKTQDQHDGFEYPFGGADVAQNDVGKLQRQPCHNDVGDSYTKDVTAS